MLKKAQLTILALFCIVSPMAQASDLPSMKTKEPVRTKLRLVSLAPSNTELIYSLKAGDQLLADSEVCDYPQEARTKEKIGNFNSIKLEKLALLKPDLVLLVSGQEQLSDKLQKHGFKTLLLDNSSVENIGKNLCEIGLEIKKLKDAKRLADAFQDSLNSLKALTGSGKTKPRVFICVWPQPLMSAGKNSFMSEGVTISGGINCTSEIAQAYPRINQERLLLLRPDFILIPHEQLKDEFWKKPPWTSMEAVRKNQLIILPQHETDCLNRPTLRFIDALYFLANKLHPELADKLKDWYGKSRARLLADFPPPQNCRSGHCQANWTELSLFS